MRATWRKPTAWPASLALLLSALLTACGEKEPRAQAPASRPEAPPDPGRTARAALAGRWYPGEPAELGRTIDRLLAEAATPALPGRIAALVAPHAGLAWSGAVAAHAWAAVRERPPLRVVLLGPAHRYPLRGIALPDWEAFATPTGTLRVDREAVARLARRPPFALRPEAHQGEHCLEMQLIFAARLLPAARIVPGLVGSLDEEGVRRAAEILREELGPRDLLAVSSDFTHYGESYGYLGRPPLREDVPGGLAALDGRAWALLEEGSPEPFLAFCRETGITICGRLPLAVLLAALPAGARAHRLRYDTSGRMSGDWSSSVSYLAGAFTVPEETGAKREASMTAPAGPLNEEERRLARQIAWQAAVAWVCERRRLEPARAGLAPQGALLQELACFVTLKRRGELRGCIGSLQARGPLWRDLVDRAIDAASRDSRFEPVQPEELPEIAIEVSVLTPMRPVKGPEEIALGRHGIVLAKQGQRALFLPQVAPEQGWDLPATLTHLAKKAGLPPDAWREGCRFEVFEAQVF